MAVAKKAPAEKAQVKKENASVKKTPKKEEKVISPIEQILDPANNDNIFLFNENQEAVEFEQVAIIPYADEVYVILSPVEPFEDVKDGEAVVFKVTEELTGDVYLDVEENDSVIDVIFDIYYKLYEEANSEKGI